MAKANVRISDTRRFVYQEHHMSNELISASTGLSLISRINEFQTVAKLFADSGMFSDAKGAAQCFVKIMAGAELGLPPFTAMNAFHVIQGKPTMAANTIAARLKASGKYNYRIVEKSATKCTIDFFEAGEKVHTETWDVERARRANVKNMAAFPEAMLFARAITSGARAIAPDVVGQFYTPEELGVSVNEHGEIVDGNFSVTGQSDAPEPTTLKPVSADNRAIVSSLIDQHTQLNERAKNAGTFSDEQKRAFIGEVNTLAQNVNAQLVLRDAPQMPVREKTSQTFSEIGKALNILAEYDQHAPLLEQQPA